MTPPEFAVVGRLRKAHGVQGELVAEPITDAPDAVFAPGRRLFAGMPDGTLDPARRELHVVAARPFKGGRIVSFREITDRSEAERWRDRYLLLPLAELEPPGEGEIFMHELPGMQVVLVGGAVVGVIRELFELPQGLVMDIDDGARGVMMPYSANVVVEVDTERRVVTVDPPAGLLE
jgi:16S rRNA processing protein RimM